MGTKCYRLTSYDTTNKVLNVEYYMNDTPSLKVNIPLPLPDEVDTPEEIDLYVQQRWPEEAYQAAVKKAGIDDKKVEDVLSSLMKIEKQIDDSNVLYKKSAEGIIDVSAINVVKV